MLDAQCIMVYPKMIRIIILYRERMQNIQHHHIYVTQSQVLLQSALQSALSTYCGSLPYR